MKKLLITAAMAMIIQVAFAQDSTSQDRFNQYGRIVSRSPLDVEMEYLSSNLQINRIDYGLTSGCRLMDRCFQKTH